MAVPGVDSSTGSSADGVQCRGSGLFRDVGVVGLAGDFILRVEFEGPVWGRGASRECLGMEFGSCVVADFYTGGLLLLLADVKRKEKKGGYAFGGEGLRWGNTGVEFSLVGYCLWITAGWHFDLVERFTWKTSLMKIIKVTSGPDKSKDIWRQAAVG
jgi:hypothetical protein